LAIEYRILNGVEVDHPGVQCRLVKDLPGNWPHLNPLQRRGLKLRSFLEPSPLERAGWGTSY